MRRTILFFAVLALVLPSCGAGTEDDGSTKTTTPGVSASGATDEPSPSGSTASVPVGTWTGEAAGRDMGTFSVRVTIPPCGLGELCGQFDEATSDYEGAPSSCGGILIYMRTQDDDLVFQEEITYNRGNFTCMGMPMFLTPIDERTLRFKEYAGVNYGSSRGTLHLADETP